MALRNRDAKSETFPLRVKRWRAYLGVTQKQFAALWGVSPSMVQKIEANDYGVGQLSFDRLESLRELLKLEPAVFYGILSENDPGQNTDEVVKVARLGAGLEPALPISLPTLLLEPHLASELLALELSPQTFAPDRLRYALSPDALVVLRKDAAPRLSDFVVGTKTLHAQSHVVIFRVPTGETPIFLRPFDPDDERCFELRTPEEVDLLGVYVGHWTTLNAR